jgi:hypothetical protein
VGKKEREMVRRGVKVAVGLLDAISREDGDG